MTEEAALDPALAEVRQRYLEGELVLFVGAGVSAAAGLPSWRRLIETLVERARVRRAAPDLVTEVGRLLAADRYVDAITAASYAVGERDFITVVKSALDDRHVRELPALGRAIAALSPHLRAVLTTNLDNLLEFAFGGRWPALHRATAGAAQDSCVILKLHGTLRDPETWVMTRRQYDRAMYNDPRLADTVAAIFRTRTLLFVGYGLADDDFDQVLARMRALSGGTPPQHYALVLGTQATPYWMRAREDAGVRVIPYASHEDLPNILQWIAGTGDAPVPKRVEPPPSPLDGGPALAQSAHQPSPAGAVSPAQESREDPPQDTTPRERRRRQYAAVVAGALMLLGAAVLGLTISRLHDQVDQLKNDIDKLKRDNDLLGSKNARLREETESLRQVRRPIALFGSGNVHAYLLGETAALKSFEPLWIDTASGRALDQVFAAFNYGRASFVTERGGALALSSSGNKHLKDVIRLHQSTIKNDSALEHNYFLSIDIAKRPLIVLYRQVGEDKLPVTSPSAERDYPVVQASDLMKLLSGPTLHGVTRYIPEEGSGTRDAFGTIAKPGFAWPVGEPAGPYKLDMLGDTEPFFMIISEVPSPGVIPADDPHLCKTLTTRRMNVAAILHNQHVVYATFSVAMKLVLDESRPKDGAFVINDPAECEVARAFLKAELADGCRLREVSALESHVVERRAEKPPSMRGDPLEDLQPQLRHCRH